MSGRRLPSPGDAWRKIAWLALLSWPAWGGSLIAQTGPERRIEVQVENDKVSLLELARATLEAYGLPGRELRFKDVRIPVRGVPGTLFRVGLAAALGKTARIRLSESGTRLLVTIDRRQSRRLRQKAKRRLLAFISRCTGQDLLARRYVLSAPGEMAHAEPLVVLIHGVDAGLAGMADLRAHLVAQGFAVGGFAYPNDEAVDAAGAALADRLRAFAKQEPNRPVFLVAHSMGGLVARWAIETPKLDPGNVRLLIMLGTPNRGSYLAVARFLLDAGGYVRDRATKVAFHDRLRDGLGEAGHDLRPGSVVLRQLNARSRNPAVAYRLALGTRAPVGADELAALVEKATARAGSLAPWLREKAADLDEIVQGKGDCAVAVERGKLEGVEPVLVPLDHRALVARRGLLTRHSDAAHPVFDAVTRWLREQREAIQKVSQHPRRRRNRVMRRW